MSVMHSKQHCVLFSTFKQTVMTYNQYEPTMEGSVTYNHIITHYDSYYKEFKNVQ